MPVKGYISKKRNGVTQCKIPRCTIGPNNKGCFCKGFCKNHYDRYRIGLIDIAGNPTGSPSKRTAEKIKRQEDRKTLLSTHGASYAFERGIELLTNHDLKKLLKPKESK